MLKAALDAGDCQLSGLVCRACAGEMKELTGAETNFMHNNYANLGPKRGSIESRGVFHSPMKHST